MHTKKFILNQSAHWQLIKDINELIPGLMISVFLVNLIIETVISGCHPALMISSEKKYLIWVFYFIGKKETDSLNAVVSPIDIVTHEEISIIFDIPSKSE